MCLNYSVIDVTPVIFTHREYKAIIFDTATGKDVYITSIRLSADKAECDALQYIHEQENK